MLTFDKEREKRNAELIRCNREACMYAYIYLWIHWSCTRLLIVRDFAITQANSYSRKNLRYQGETNYETRNCFNSCLRSQSCNLAVNTKADPENASFRLTFICLLSHVWDASCASSFIEINQLAETKIKRYVESTLPCKIRHACPKYIIHTQIIYIYI